MYRVLTPIYESTGESGSDAEGRRVRWNVVKEWTHLGYADSMADALRQFPRCKRNGYSPVLEYVGSLH